MREIKREEKSEGEKERKKIKFFRGKVQVREKKKVEGGRER